MQCLQGLGGSTPPTGTTLAVNLSEPRRFTTSDGVRLAYGVDDFTDPWRTPPSVVLLHAAMSNLRRFHAWIPILARDFRVVRLDARGHGDSTTPDPDQPITIDRLTRDVVELLDHLGLERVHVSGSSGGGYVAQWLAITHPQRVDRLALFSTTPGLAFANPAARVSTWPATVRARGVDGLIAETLAARVDPGRVDPGFVRWMIAEAGRMDRDFTARFLGAMAELDLSDRVHEIKAPTLVVVAGADTVCGAAGTSALRRIPDHRWVVYEGLPHNITNGVPERCATELRGFLLDR
jgi:3-oxoadipate enol-lactonase